MKKHLDPLPCEECTKTNNHCCTTNLHLNLPEAMMMMNKAHKLGFDTVLGLHPNNNGNELVFMMVPNKPGIDVQREPCVFLDSDGKCLNYEDRPSICRAYGTEIIRCRFEYSNVTTQDQIKACDFDMIKMLDKKAMEIGFPYMHDLKTFQKS